MSLCGPIPDFLARQASLRPDHVALEDIRSGRCLDYRGLDREADRAAGLLWECGIRAGARVGILCRNRPEFFELLFACARIGAFLVPLNWRMAPGELDQVLQDCTPSLLIAGSEDEVLVGSLAAQWPLLKLDSGYEEAKARAVPAPVLAERTADDIWYLIYTSGTTGMPKGVIYTFGMALANYVNIANAIGLSPGQRTVNYLPLFHTAGINLHTLPVLVGGGHVHVLGGFDGDLILRLLEERRLDSFFGVPTVYRDLLDHPQFGRAPLAAVRHWSCGGAPLPRATAEECRALGIRLCAGMGMTETGPTAFLQQPHEAWTKMGSVGRPQLLCRARIVDEDGEEAGAGVVGEIEFAGPGVTPGYWNGQRFEGWLRSGDFGWRDAQGAFYVAGRKAELIVSGGEKIHPAEVEAVLLSHPDVEEAAVIGRPDHRWGEAVHAIVRLGDGLMVQPESLIAFCRAHLASYKVPKSFAQVRDFPRTASGKIRKQDLA